MWPGFHFFNWSQHKLWKLTQQQMIQHGIDKLEPIGTLRIPLYMLMKKIWWGRFYKDCNDVFYIPIFHSLKYKSITSSLKTKPATHSDKISVEAWPAVLEPARAAVAASIIYATPFIMAVSAWTPLASSTVFPFTWVLCLWIRRQEHYY